MAQKSFTAQVGDWVEKSERAKTAVFRESAQRVISDAQTPRGEGGRMRVDTGFLRASGQASLSGMPTIQPNAQPEPGGNYSWSESEVSLVILSATLSDTVHFGYTAAYAAAREYGARGQTPDAFVRGAAQKWQAIVADVSREVRRRFP